MNEKFRKNISTYIMKHTLDNEENLRTKNYNKKKEERKREKEKERERERITKKKEIQSKNNLLCN
jgi:hypothetical protein